MTYNNELSVKGIAPQRPLLLPLVTLSAQPKPKHLPAVTGHDQHPAANHYRIPANGTERFPCAAMVPADIGAVGTGAIKVSRLWIVAGTAAISIREAV